MLRGGRERSGGRRAFCLKAADEGWFAELWVGGCAGRGVSSAMLLSGSGGSGLANGLDRRATTAT